MGRIEAWCIGLVGLFLWLAVSLFSTNPFFTIAMVGLLIYMGYFEKLLEKKRKEKEAKKNKDKREKKS